MFKVELWLSVIFERRGLVFFVEQRDFDDPGSTICSSKNHHLFRGPVGARHVGGRRRDTHTAKCENTVKHYFFFSDISFYQEYIRTRVCNTTNWGLARRNFK